MKIATKSSRTSDLISQKPHRAIICGDFNARIQNYGSSYSNARGGFFHRLENFTILNTDQPTLLQRPNNNPTAPDFTIVSDQLIDQFTWQVADLALGSDHYPIRITASQSRPPQGKKPLPPPVRRKLHQADWDKYTQFL
jgi:endonuclease/exonuclease/phosphatase family metal-dependent hydrolase